MKSKALFICQKCGFQSPKWVGKCNGCGEWNTFVEEIVQINQTKTSKPSVVFSRNVVPQKLSEFVSQNEERINTQNIEFNRVLGGGLVKGSLVLIGGEPGIGKSTLALQVALHLKNLKILYISGEESGQQIKLRAERLEIKNDLCYILTETALEEILLRIGELQPDLVIIDSIQTVFTEKIESSPGSVSQIRECTSLILRFAKENHLPFILIGHITKEGSIAGPKVLEHIVDTVLQFEGDQNQMYRILRSMKNRFGSTSELGIYEMRNTGLREVSNPSELLLSQFEEQYSGVAISASIEGVRPFLIEVQSLVGTSVYSTPQRSSTGFDIRRLNMLLAVLEKRVGFRLTSKDVFLNLAGGIRIDDTGIDLAVLCAVLSSDLDISIDKRICFAGEVGLSGEIRPVHRIEQRIGEAQKLGFQQIFISKYNQKGIDFSKFSIKVHFCSRVDEVFRNIFGKKK